MLVKILLVSNLVICAYLTGLIWVIQALHYPSFAKIDSQQFSDFHIFHTQRITLIVALPMVLELLFAFLLFLNLGSKHLIINHLQLALVVLVWINTFFFAIPIHQSLESGIDLAKINALVQVNWYRTIAWTLRLFLLIYLMLLND